MQVYYESSPRTDESSQSINGITDIKPVKARQTYIPALAFRLRILFNTPSRQDLSGASLSIVLSTEYCDK